MRLGEIRQPSDRDDRPAVTQPVGQVDSQSLVFAEHVESQTDTDVYLEIQRSSRRHRRIPHPSDVGKHRETCPDGADSPHGSLDFDCSTEQRPPELVAQHDPVSKYGVSAQ